jgi:prevent-host-death family protein
MGKVYGMAEFKARCTRIVAELEQTGEVVTITNRGRPVAELRPAAKRERKSATFGFLKHPYYHGDDDLTAPAYERPWNAELGILD